MKKTILVVTGASLLVLSAMLSMGYGPVAAQQSYSQQTGQQNTAQSGGNDTGTGNVTAQQTNLAATGQADANATTQLHAFLDAAIISAKNNDTRGMMASLSQIMDGLGNMSNPVTEAAGTNDTMTSSQQAGNQTGATGSSGAATNNSNTGTVTGGKAGDVDSPVSEGPQEIPSDFPDR
jgi:hypothetical protein